HRSSPAPASRHAGTSARPRAQAADRRGRPLRERGAGSRQAAAEGHMSEVAVVPDVARAAAELFVEATAGAVAARGTAAVALTGGSTAAPLYAELLDRWTVPWEKLQIFFTDERAVPEVSELSNYRLAREGLLGK